MSKSLGLQDGCPSSLQFPDRAQDISASSSDAISSPVHVSQQSSRHPSPFIDLPDPESFDPDTPNLFTPKDDENRGRRKDRGEEEDHDSDLETWNEHYPLTSPSQPHDMPSDLRSQHHSTKSQQPLLSQDKTYTDYASPHRPAIPGRTSRFHERDPEESAKSSTRKRYTYAACFFILSLISFTIQTETAVYIQHTLKWNKAYSML